MPIKLNGATSGSVELDVPAVVSGGDVTLTLPPNLGTADQVLQTNGSGTLSFSHLYGPAARAHLTADQAVGNAVWTTAILNGIDFDTDNCFDVSTGRCTPTKAGIYHVSVESYLNYSSGSPNRYGIRIYKNNVRLQGDVQSAPASFWGICNADTLVELNGTTDFVDLRVYLLGATAGGSAAPDYTNMSVIYMRPS